MRMNKLVGVGLLVVVLAMLSVVAGFGVGPLDSLDVTVNFAIPSYIAIYAEQESVSLPVISDPGTYLAENQLTVVSTASWHISHAISWTTMPNFPAGNGFQPDGAGGMLFTASSNTTSGVFGLHLFSVDYILDLSGDNMQYFPEGEYEVTVTHTATTSE